MGEEVVCGHWAWTTVDDDIIEHFSLPTPLAFGFVFFFHFQDVWFYMVYGALSLTLMAHLYLSTHCSRKVLLL